MNKNETYLLDILQGKWRVTIIEAMLHTGPRQFADLKADVEGISAKVLTENLYFFIKCGIVSKKSYPVFPPKTEYSLTDKGEKIGPILNEIYRWSVENYAPPTEEVKDDFYSVFK